MINVQTLFKKSNNALEPGGVELPVAERRDCPECKYSGPLAEFKQSFRTCPQCGYHQRIGARLRMRYLYDDGSFIELAGNITSADPLCFPGYCEKLERANAESQESEAAVCGTALCGGLPCAVFAMDSGFMMGSMGSAVGERITRLFEHATVHGLPVIGHTASGGARMQEGILSLMQMAKVSAAVRRHGDAGNLYIAVLTDPTTGGVTASFAMQADIILAEPGATIGFAGKRVIEQTTKATLPDDFQTAESMLAHGFIDSIVPRQKQREILTRLLSLHKIEELPI